jgi:hypothetical protein
VRNELPSVSIAELFDAFPLSRNGRVVPLALSRGSTVSDGSEFRDVVRAHLYPFIIGGSHVDPYAFKLANCFAVRFAIRRVLSFFFPRRNAFRIVRVAAVTPAFFKAAVASSSVHPFFPIARTTLITECPRSEPNFPFVGALVVEIFETFFVVLFLFFIVCCFVVEPCLSMPYDEDAKKNP